MTQRRQVKFLKVEAVDPPLGSIGLFDLILRKISVAGNLGNKYNEIITDAQYRQYQ
jgi:hypothetical protein